MQKLEIEAFNWRYPLLEILKYMVLNVPVDKLLGKIKSAFNDP